MRRVKSWGTVILRKIRLRPKIVVIRNRKSGPYGRQYSDGAYIVQEVINGVPWHYWRCEPCDVRQMSLKISNGLALRGGLAHNIMVHGWKGNVEKFESKSLHRMRKRIFVYGFFQYD